MPDKDTWCGIEEDMKSFDRSKTMHKSGTYRMKINVEIR